MMKRIMALTLLCLYLFGTTEVCQLLKLPFLFNHYLEHNHHEKINLSFFEYLKLHYSSDSNSSNKHNEDSKLPFKTSDECCIAGHISIPVTGYSIPLPQFYNISNSYPFYKNDAFLPMTVQDIFQPPRLS